MNEIPTKPAVSEEHRLSKLSWRSLEIEARRHSRKPATKLDGAIADILLITFFQAHKKDNDPYILDHKSWRNSYWDMYSGTRKKAKK